MKASTLDKWNPNVRRLLNEMGFFELLRMSPLPSGAPPSGERYVKFRSGSKVDGELVHNFRNLDLSPHISVPNQIQLFGAITEAMTNVRHHAYQDREFYDPGPPYWWLSAAYDTQDNTLTVMLYDQG